MPVIKNPKREQPLQARELKQSIVQEWLKPSIDDPNKPVIVIEEKKGFLGNTHITVVWYQWPGMTQRERSEVIMDACEEVLSDAEVRDITVAMGLTKAEAERMNIHYQ